MTTDDLLRAGIEAARAGDLERAANYFAHVVQADPASEKGWYGLGMCLTQPERRVFCLRRVLALNPNHMQARAQLDQLLAPLPESAPPEETPRAPAPAPQPPPAAAPVPSPVTPPSESEAPTGVASKPPTEDVSKVGGWSPKQWPPPMPKYEAPSETPETTPEPVAIPKEPREELDWLGPVEAEAETPFIGGDDLDRLASLAPAEPASPQAQGERPVPAQEPEAEPPRPAWLESPPARPQSSEPAEGETPFGVSASIEAQLRNPSLAGMMAASPARPAPSVKAQVAATPAAVPATKAPAAGRAQPRSAPVKAPAKPKKRGKGGTIVLIVISVLLLMLCALVIVYLAYSGILSQLLSRAPAVVVPTALLLPTTPPTQVLANQAALPAATEVPPTATPTLLPTPKPTVSYTPSFESAACQFDSPKGAHVTCGYLIVPEDRTGDPTHTIRLAVAIYHSASSSPAAEPVLFLQGGPGGEAVKLSAAAYSALVQPFLSQRDFIAYDQRGTGLSEPALDCPDLTKAYLQDIYGQIPASTRKIVYTNAFLSCQGQTSVGGVNLNAYTTEESAADVKDLLQVLKYSQVDLYGASYGTRLAQVVMRDDPGIVHAAILDSVVPIETNFFAEYPQSIEGALKQLFDACNSDAACNAAYPDLETVFWDQVSRLDAKPVPLTVANPQTGTVTESVDGSVFINVVLTSLKMSSLIESAPQTIYRFKAGDYSALIAAENSLPYAFEGINIGLYITMMCHEQILRTTPDELQSAMASSLDIQTYAWLPFFGNAQDVYRYCQSWKTAGPYLGENDPVSSDIPTLIVTGKFDPTTPPKYAELVASHLSHSYYVEFPDQGHTPTAADSTGCAMDMAVAFLADPQVEPDRSCLNSIAPMAFVLPYTGTPPIELKTVDVGGISVRMPRGWTSLGDGFYLRANSPFDITQIGVTQVPGTTSADLLNWLSQKAWGYRGLDAAPVWSSQRTANGLDWALYTATSYGRPVDIAMADHSGSSIVVLAFSDIDEHEALFPAVFLPVVDSIRP